MPTTCLTVTAIHGCRVPTARSTAECRDAHLRQQELTTARAAGSAYMPTRDEGYAPPQERAKGQRTRQIQ